MGGNVRFRHKGPCAHVELFQDKDAYAEQTRGGAYCYTCDATIPWSVVLADYDKVPD